MVPLVSARNLTPSSLAEVSESDGDDGVADPKIVHGQLRAPTVTVALATAPMFALSSVARASSVTSPPTVPPPLSVAVPLTVTVEPACTVSPALGAVIVAVGATVSVDAVGAVSPDIRVPG